MLHVIGSNSTIGGALLAHGVAESGTDRAALDLADPGAVAAYRFPGGVTHAVFAAAVTSMAACRDRFEQALQVNTHAPAELARTAEAQGVRCLLLSTNQVFDGTVPHVQPDGPTCPRSAYGRTKADAEAAVLERGGSVLRLTKVFPDSVLDEPRLAGWLKTLGNGGRVSAFDDLRLAPVAIHRVVDAVLAWLGGATPRVFQRSGPEDITWFDLAQQMAAAANAPADHVRRSSAASAGVPAEERPRHTTLSE